MTQHALAITQAGAFISQGLCKLNEYPKFLKEQRARLLRYRPEQADSIYGDVYATFEVSAEAMLLSSKQEWKDALELLQVLAFLHQEGVPEKMFTKAWDFQCTASKLKKHPNFEKFDILYPSAWHVNHMHKVLHALVPHGGVGELDVISLRKARSALQSFSLIRLN